MSVEDQNIPPVPSQSSLNEMDKTLVKIGPTWTQWFEVLRTKINVLNSSIVALANTTTNGILVHIVGGWTTRTITGTPDEITVSNGDGITGNPVIDMPNTTVVPGNYISANITVRADGRISAASNGSGGGGGNGDGYISTSGDSYETGNTLDLYIRIA